jgi:S1-C subfamily serine protease
VVAPQLVVTNAHVVAGLKKPVAQDDSGGHRATVVYFDPRLDLAILRIPDLTTPPLRLATGHANRGTVGAVLGYPGGGHFTVDPAAILGRQTAQGRTIYGTDLITREIYELQAKVRPGNSGGPVVAPDGSVLGVVFAMSTSQDNLGYALTAAQVAPALAAAATNSAVSTGPCLAE